MSNDPLIEQLRTQAAADSPRFSQALHDRIMRRLGSSATIDEPPGPLRLRWGIPTSLVAAAAAVIAVGSWLHITHLPSPARQQIAQVPSLPTIPNPVEQLDTMPDLTDARYAYLDRDGERFLNFMARQLDIAPTKR